MPTGATFTHLFGNISQNFSVGSKIKSNLGDYLTIDTNGVVIGTKSKDEAATVTFDILSGFRKY